MNKGLWTELLWRESKAPLQCCGRWRLAWVQVEAKEEHPRCSSAIGCQESVEGFCAGAPLLPAVALGSSLSVRRCGLALSTDHLCLPPFAKHRARCCTRVSLLSILAGLSWECDRPYNTRAIWGLETSSHSLRAKMPVNTGGAIKGRSLGSSPLGCFWRE